MLRSAIDEWGRRHGWSPPEEGVGKLEVLLGLWLRYGRVMNLTGARTEGELVTHVLDGLETALCARAAGVIDGGRWMDVGSGGGFPGLVVASVTSHRIVLFEPRAKRASFLDLAIQAAKLEHARLEKRAWECSTWNESVASGGVDVASARAVFGPAEWLRRGSMAVRGGGIVLVHAREPDVKALGDPVAVISGTHGVVAAYRVERRTALEGVASDGDVRGADVAEPS